MWLFRAPCGCRQRITTSTTKGCGAGCHRAHLAAVLQAAVEDLFRDGGGVSEARVPVNGAHTRAALDVDLCRAESQWNRGRGSVSVRGHMAGPCDSTAVRKHTRTRRRGPGTGRLAVGRLCAHAARMRASTRLGELPALPLHRKCHGRVGLVLNVAQPATRFRIRRADLRLGEGQDT